MSNEKQVIKIYPKNMCGRKAPIVQKKVKQNGDTNIIVYGRDMDAICPQCGKKYKDHN